MWPFSKIWELENEIERLKMQLLSEPDKEELKFLREVIKDYVEYSRVRGVFSISRYYNPDRTLKCAERDFANSKLLVAALESQTSKEAIARAYALYDELKEACEKQNEVKLK
jgi:predicted transcriptional regulator